MSKTIRLTFMFIGIIFFSSLIYFGLNSTNDHHSFEMIHYTEFDGRITIENRCIENLSCYGFDESGEKIVLDWSKTLMNMFYKMMQQ